MQSNHYVQQQQQQLYSRRETILTIFASRKLAKRVFEAGVNLILSGSSVFDITKQKLIGCAEL